ncbi:MAG: hypothetical protein K6T17_01910 [Fimbriimonadales bacterium]|nr:hypothetical protein [Fimbriimonadales bacterium]
MSVKDLLIRQLKRAVDDLFRSVRAMPGEKITWQTSETARTPLDILQECALSLKWPQSILGNKQPTFDLPEEEFQKIQAERARLTSVDACEETARKNLAETIEFIRSYPEDDLDRVISLPFAPNLDLTVAEILASPYWNITYHLGQINYIQTMYGDRENH